MRENHSEADNPTDNTRSPRIFWGWWIVLVTFLGSLAASGIGNFGLGVFVVPMTLDLGWSRTALGGVFAVRAVVHGVVGPLIGWAADRPTGARVLMTVAGVVAGLSLILMAFVTQLWQFYIVFGVLWSVGQMAMGGNIIGSTLISKWFIRKRGRAMGFFTMGSPTGGLIFVPLNALLLAWFGWQGAWIALAFLSWALMVPLAATFVRRQPEDVGLLPDGRPATPTSSLNKEAAATTTRATAEVSWTPKMAMRTRAFWLLLPAFTLMSLPMGAMTIHQVPALTDKGMTLAEASLLTSLLYGTSMIVKPFAGLLAERFTVRYLLAGCYVLAGSSFLLLVSGSATVSLVPYALLYGVGAGSNRVLVNVAWADYYGRRFHGSLRGVIEPISALALGFSPLFAGWVYDTTGSYDTAFRYMAYGIFAAAILVLLAKPPRWNKSDASLQ
ncbi:MAG: MFS transporter [Chloroflexi bacterium]|nr:MFS transporter [Chloroflexota bacterium]